MQILEIIFEALCAHIDTQIAVSSARIDIEEAQTHTHADLITHTPRQSTNAATGRSEEDAARVCDRCWCCSRRCRKSDISEAKNSETLNPSSHTHTKTLATPPDHPTLPFCLLIFEECFSLAPLLSLVPVRF